MAAALRISVYRCRVFMKKSLLNPGAVAVCRLFSDRIVDPPYLGPSIPNYRVREDESIEMKRARLLYQSRKRGMLENGLLLSTFADKFLDSFDQPMLEQYDKLINQPTNDWDLYYWMTENQPTPEEYDFPVMDMMKKHAKNEDRDVRLRQPDLKLEVKE